MSRKTTDNGSRASSNERNGGKGYTRPSSDSGSCEREHERVTFSDVFDDDFKIEPHKLQAEEMSKRREEPHDRNFLMDKYFSS
jgi:hypothetical protein